MGRALEHDAGRAAGINRWADHADRDADIFRGIRLNSLGAGNSCYLLRMMLGFLVVTRVLVLSLGRLGDLYGRVRMYNLGFVLHTTASLFLTVDWLTGRSGATYLIVFRVVQGIGYGRRNRLGRPVGLQYGRLKS